MYDISGLNPFPRCMVLIIIGPLYLLKIVIGIGMLKQLILLMPMFPSLVLRLLTYLVVLSHFLLYYLSVTIMNLCSYYAIEDCPVSF